ncbi:DUF4382 domain-containing protein [[Eubacterium] cellulosolvens]
MSPRQIFSAILLIIVIVIILYPATAIGTVRLNAQYKQAIIYSEIPGEEGPLEITGVTNLEVSFSDVEIHLANAENYTGWLPISYQTEKLDLVGNTGNSKTILLTPTIPVGEYDMIGLTFSDTFATFNGTTVKVETEPQFVVLDYPFTVKSGSETELNLEFIADYRGLNNSKKVFFEVNPMPD